MYEANQYSLGWKTDKIGKLLSRSDYVCVRVDQRKRRQTGGLCMLVYKS